MNNIETCVTCKWCSVNYLGFWGRLIYRGIWCKCLNPKYLRACVDTTPRFADYCTDVRARTWKCAQEGYGHEPIDTQGEYND